MHSIMSSDPNQETIAFLLPMSDPIMSSDPTTSPQPHVAVFAFPFASHPGNLFTFARMLAVAASNVAFSFFTSSASLASLSHAPRPDNIRLYRVDDGSPAATAHVLERIGAFVKAMPANIKAGVEEAVKEMRGVKVSCVVSDAFLWMAGEVAEEMAVPWVPLWTCGPAGLLVHLYTDEIRRKIGVLERGKEETPGKSDELLDFIPSLSTIRVRDLPLGVVSGDINSDFSVLLHRAGTNLPRATAIAFNTFEGLNPDIDAEFASIFKQSLPVGPFHLLSPPQHDGKPENNECLQWLDRQAPASVAYLGFGTIMTPPQAELQELAHGLEASGVPFLWSLKDKARDDLPAGFLERTRERGLIVAWAPQVRILGHSAVGVFVTHCGWNSVMESLAGGVPMVCRPFVGEQNVNARMMSEVWRFGVAYDGGLVAREDIARVLNLVVREEEGKMMRERVRELKERAVRAVATGGKSVENFECLLKIVRGSNIKSLKIGQQ